MSSTETQHMPNDKDDEAPCCMASARRATVADPLPGKEPKSVRIKVAKPQEQLSVDYDHQECQPTACSSNYPRSHSISGPTGSRRRVSFGELPAAMPVQAAVKMPTAPAIPERIEPGMDEGPDSMGSVISVTVPEEAQPEDRILEVGLGMLGQHTIYQAKFTVPDLGLHKDSEPGQKETCCGLELVHPLGHFNPGIKLDMISCQFNPESKGHELLVKLTTGNLCRVMETFYLRRVADPSLLVELVVKATALGKNHGTPSLHVGIHKLGHTADYEESDVQTEWQHVPEEEATDE